jgi:hypothetical protein
MAIYGISTIISQEPIFIPLIDKLERFKTLYYFLSCNKCLSVWIGFFVELAFGSTILYSICYAFMAYTFTSFVNMVEDYLDSNNKSIL